MTNPPPETTKPPIIPTPSPTNAESVITPVEDLSHLGQAYDYYDFLTAIHKGKELTTNKTK